MPDGFNVTHRREITSLSARYRVPAVYPQRIYTEIGGVLSYGNDPLDNFRRAAVYADRILKGTKPSELPVQVPVKFELVINLKTAARAADAGRTCRPSEGRNREVAANHQSCKHQGRVIQRPEIP
jgi:hypothetical protein